MSIFGKDAHLFYSKTQMTQFIRHYAISRCCQSLRNGQAHYSVYRFESIHDKDVYN